MSSAAIAAAGLDFQLKLGGSAMESDLFKKISSIVIEDGLHVPDVVEVTFFDPQMGVADDPNLAIGTDLEVSWTAPGATADAKTKAKVTALMARYDQGQGLALTARAMDPSHSLHRGRYTKTWPDKKASDVFNAVISDYDLDPGTVDPTDVTFKFLSCVNEAPFAFLRRLAAENDRELAVSEGKIHFRKTTKVDAGAAISLDPNQTITALDLVLTAADQVTTLVASGWDPATQAVLTAQATPATVGVEIATTPDALAAKFVTSAKHVIGGMHLADQAHATAVSKAAAETLGSGFAEAHGTCAGDPRIRTGATIELVGVGKAFEGKYVVTASRHEWSRVNGYHTDFTVGGRQDRSLLGLTRGSGTGWSLSGVVPAVVTDNQDKTGEGRVKVKFPWLDQHESEWARVLYPGAGDKRGFTLVPTVNDEVLVAFEHADPGHPIVLGGLFSADSAHKLPEHKGDDHTKSGKLQHQGWHTDSTRLTFHTEQGKEKIMIGLNDGSYEITLDVAGKTTTITSKGKVEIKAVDDITIKSDKGITLDASGELTLKSSKSAAMKAPEVNLTGDSKATVSAPQVAIG